MEQNNSQQAVELRFQINMNKVNIDWNVFKKSDSEREELKEDIADSKKVTPKKRDEIIMAFLNAEIPNWNISLTVK